MKIWQKVDPKSQFCSLPYLAEIIFRRKRLVKGEKEKCEEGGLEEEEGRKVPGGGGTSLQSTQRFTCSSLRFLLLSFFNNLFKVFELSAPPLDLYTVYPTPPPVRSVSIWMP